MFGKIILHSQSWKWYVRGSLSRPTIQDQILYGLDIPNAPTMEGKGVMNAVEESCTAIHVIHNCAEYNLA